MYEPIRAKTFDGELICISASTAATISLIIDRTLLSSQPDIF